MNCNILAHHTWEVLFHVGNSVLVILDEGLDMSLDGNIPILANNSGPEASRSGSSPTWPEMFPLFLQSPRPLPGVSALIGCWLVPSPGSCSAAPPSLSLPQTLPLPHLVVSLLEYSSWNYLKITVYLIWWCFSAAKAALETQMSVRPSVTTSPNSHLLTINDAWSMSVCLSVCLSVWMSVWLSDCLSDCLSVCLSDCLSDCLFCLSALKAFAA